MKKSIGIIGPKPNDLYGYDCQSYYRYNALFQTITSILEDYNTKDITDYISCGMQGVDQLFFRAVEKSIKPYNNQIQNWLYEPFPGIESRWKMKGLFSKEKYFEIRNLAILNNTYHCCHNKEPTTMKEYFHLVSKAQNAMADSSDILLCVICWSQLQGNYAKTPFYVSEFIRTHLYKNKEFILIDPSTLFIKKL